MEAVRRTGLLDAPTSEPLSRLSALAARLLEAPAAQVTLLDGRTCWSVSTSGTEEIGLRTPWIAAEESLCRYVLDRPQLMVADTRLDALTAAEPAPVRSGIRAWAGAAVRSPDGQVLGALSVLDTEPHAWTEQDAATLLTLAHAVSAEIALAVAERQARDALEISEARYRSLVRAMSNEVWYASADGRLQSDMPTWRSFTGQTREEIAGHGWLDGVCPGDRERVTRAWAAAVRSRSTFECEYRVHRVRPPADGLPGPAGADAGPDGESIRVLQVRGVPREQDGRVVEYVGVYVDVTRARAAAAGEEQLAALASAAAQSTRALHEVSMALSCAVTVAEVLTVILDQGQAKLGASGCGVALRKGDVVRYEVLRGYSADIKASWAEFSMHEDTPVTQAIRTGRPVFVESTDDLLARYGSERLRTFVRSTGEQAMLRLPLTTPSGVLGALMFGFEHPRVFTEDERRFVMALAGQCAQALERAQLYDRERNTARLLQRSLLPEALPDVPGLELSALCQSATPEVEIGGDWYDVLVLPDGRVGVVVGDVMGKGVPAASVMGQVRNALRGLVHADPAPAAVLAHLDSVVSALGEPEELVTVVYGLFDPPTGTFEWGSAGHIPPLRIAPGATDYVRGGESMPLGMGDDRPSGRLVLAAGETLLLFSDGLAESRNRSLLQGLDELVTHAERLTGGSCPPDIHSLRDRLTEVMVEASDNDDVTVLLLRRSAACPGGGAAQVADIDLPQRLTSAGAARQFVSERLEDWGAQDVRDAVLLCVSEVVTNAVVHAGSPAHLSLRISGGVLRVEVQDCGGIAIPHLRREATPEQTHGRGLVLVEAMSDRWDVVDEVDGKQVWFEVAVPGAGA